MTELYLIAHKVRGELAFDIAERMVCSECHGTKEFTTGAAFHDCNECDSQGFWWIIPTSGHRAYPYASKECEWDELSVGLPPDDLPDHYAHCASPTIIRHRLEALLAALPPAPVKQFKRRF